MGVREADKPGRITPEALMARARRRISTEYCVQTGAPSWHQQRAGHISAGGMCFFQKSKATKYMRNFKKHHPHEPAFITTTRKLQHFLGARRRRRRR